MGRIPMLNFIGRKIRKGYRATHPYVKYSKEEWIRGRAQPDGLKRSSGFLLRNRRRILSKMQAMIRPGPIRS